MTADARDYAAIQIIHHNHPQIPPLDDITRAITCRRLATVEVAGFWHRRRITGTLLQDTKNRGYSWVTAAKGARSVYGRIVATHGTVWPDRTHSGPEYPINSKIPYTPPPEGWVYAP